MHALRTVFVGALLLIMQTPASFAQEKVIFDTDFNVIGDDGQAFIMLAQLQAAGKVNVLGLTVVSGNEWLDQGVADALKAVERMGLEQIPVLRGTLHPLVHDYDSIKEERSLYGADYVGAWRKPAPVSDKDLVPPPDGFAERVNLSATHAVDFIIEQVTAHPREVTIIAVGPATNLALAVRKAPDIVPLIKRIIWMGGAIEVPGNTTPAAEFNWWFDPEAAKIVLREPIPQVIVPLDVTNKTVFDKRIYDRIVSPSVPATPVTRLWESAWRDQFATDPKAQTFVWDTIAIAYLADPSLVTDKRNFFVDVDAAFGPNYGRSLGYAARKSGPDGAPEASPVQGLHQAEVIIDIDQERFWTLFVDLMTRPVPVRPTGRTTP